jgi:hypothetical protein
MVSYTCPICGKETHHPEDVRFGYCVACHAFTRSCVFGPCKEQPTRVWGNVSACPQHSEAVLETLARETKRRGRR